MTATIAGTVMTNTGKRILLVVGNAINFITQMQMHHL